MRAIAINEFGGNDKLKLMNLPEPKPKAGEVLIQLKAASLNHLDIWVRKGLFKIPFPHILGADGAGIIVEVGEGVNHLKVGEKVLISPGIGCGICQECASGRENNIFSISSIFLNSKYMIEFTKVIPSRRAFLTNTATNSGRN